MNRVPLRPRLFSLRLRVIDSSGLGSGLSFEVRVVRASDLNQGADGAGDNALFTSRGYDVTLADTVTLTTGDQLLKLHLRRADAADVRFHSTDPRFEVDSGSAWLLVTDKWEGLNNCAEAPLRIGITVGWTKSRGGNGSDNCTVTLTWFAVKNTPPRFRSSTFYEMPWVDEDLELGECFDLPVSSFESKIRY